MSAVLMESPPAAPSVFRPAGRRSREDEAAAYRTALHLFYHNIDFRRHVLASIESARKERERKKNDDDLCKMIVLVCWAEYQRSQQLKLATLQQHVDMHERLMASAEDLRQSDDRITLYTKYGELKVSRFLMKIEPELVDYILSLA
jgi:hypothetical protein